MVFRRYDSFLIQYENPRAQDPVKIKQQMPDCSMYGRIGTEVPQYIPENSAWYTCYNYENYRNASRIRFGHSDPIVMKPNEARAEIEIWDKRQYSQNL